VLKRIFILVAIGIFLSACSPDKTDENKIQKSMGVTNPELEFSRACRIKDKTAYIKITSISSYNSEDLWGDLQLLAKNNIENLVIYLNSPGGAAFQGLAITDELRIFKEKKIRITAEGRGLIASAAVPVFLIADHRIASKYTIFLIHPAKLWKWGLFAESLDDLQSQAKMIGLLQSNYAENVAACSKLTKEQILEMMKKDTWFTAEEALKYGFVDEIK